jgi:hypothetical protein
MAMDEQHRKGIRRAAASSTQPITVDTTGRIIDSATSLENPPAVINTDVTVELVSQPELERIYTSTLPARIKQSFIDGEGIIYTSGIGLTALAITTAINVYYWVVTAVHTLAANAALIATDCGLAVLAIVAVIYLLGGRGGNGTVVVKGCAKSGFPGPVRISR